LDPGTLVIVLLVVCGVTACLLAHTWLQNRSTPALGVWAICFMLWAAVAGIIAARGTIPELVALDAANALRLLAFGLAWQSARMLFDRKGSWLVAVLPAALWTSAALFHLFGDGLRLRLLLAVPVLAAYALAVAGELWRGSSKAQRVSRTIAFVLGLHAMALATRFFLALFLPESDLYGTLAHPMSPISLLECVAVTVACAPLLITAAKDQVLSQYRRAALLDPLTGVSNRRGFDLELQKVLARALRDRSPTALMLLDLDHFKAVNDNWGHVAGDRVLQMVARTIAAELRAGDLIGRLGGEEFVIALADCHTEEAAVLAERIRRSVAGRVILKGDAEIRLTISIGVASACGANSPDALIGDADAALYRAKAAGRDRIACAPERSEFPDKALEAGLVRRVA
jgi:diguanylate cyclase (GGDEF)-like protein